MEDLANNLRDIDQQVIDRLKNASVSEQEYLPPASMAIISDDLIVSFEDDDSTLKDVEALQDHLNGESGLSIINSLDAYCLKETVINGLYSRTLLMPKDMIIIGAMHKTEYIDMMISGDLTVKNYHSDKTVESAERFKGFNEFKGMPGRKRVLIIHEDTLWVTVDHTTKDTIEEAREEIAFVKNYDYLEYQRGIEL